MSAQTDAVSPRRPRRARRALLELGAAALVIGALLSLAASWLIGLGHELILGEAERQLRSYALLAAGRIDAADLEAVHTPQDMDSLAFRRVHSQLMRLRASNAEVRWVYAMRYTGQGDDWVFVVDASSWDVDLDGDGAISEAERGTRPGDRYEARSANARLLDALDHSVAEMVPYDDEPWGVVISAYAPIRDAQGRTVGVLGVDMIYDNVVRKLDAITIAVIGVCVAVGFLLLYAFWLLRRLTRAYTTMVSLQRQVIAIKSTYAKFVPERVRRELEAHPDGSSLERVERDVSVMFLDMAGYTRLSEQLPGESIGELLERYFSRFLDVVHRHRGQVNETAGDGLMIIFEQDAPQGHALDAVQAAMEIQQVTAALNAELPAGEAPTRVNMGINSGTAWVGLNRFVSLTGERFTYTATGPTTNVAARVAGVAKNGDILLSEATAERIREHIEVERFGRRSLKNVGRPMMLYRPVATSLAGHVDPVMSSVSSVARPVEDVEDAASATTTRE